MNAAVLVCVVVLCIITAMLLAMCYCAPEVGEGGTPSNSRKVLGGAYSEAFMRVVTNYKGLLPLIDNIKKKVEVVHDCFEMIKNAYKAEVIDDLHTKAKNAVEGIEALVTKANRMVYEINEALTNSLKSNKALRGITEENLKHAKNAAVEVDQAYLTAKIYNSGIQTYYIATEALKLAADVKDYVGGGFWWYVSGPPLGSIISTAQKVITVSKSMKTIKDLSEAVHASPEGEQNPDLERLLIENIIPRINSTKVYSEYAKYIISLINEEKLNSGAEDLDLKIRVDAARQEEETARQAVARQAEEAARLQAVARQAETQEAARQAAETEAQQVETQEAAARQAAETETRRVEAQEAAALLEAEEAARLQAEEMAQRRALQSEEAARLVVARQAEARRRPVSAQEAARQEAEARRRLVSAQEAARQEAETIRLAGRREEEAARLAAEAAAARQAEAARLAARQAAAPRPLVTKAETRQEASSTDYIDLPPLLPSQRLINYRQNYSRGQENLDVFNVVLDTGDIPPGAHSDYILQASSLNEIEIMARELTNRPGGPRMLYGLVVDHPGDKVALYKAIAIVLNMRPPAAIENQKADRAHAATGFLYSIVRFESGGFYVKAEGLIKPELYNVN